MGLSSATTPFCVHPLADVRRTIPQLDALDFTRDQKTHEGDIDKRHFVQVEHELGLEPTHLCLELPEVFGLNATDETKRRRPAIGGCFNLQSHCGCVS